MVRNSSIQNSPHARMMVISLAQVDMWKQALKSMTAYDFYHTPEYHALARNTGEGEPLLFLYSEGEYRIALPLLNREITEVPNSSGSDIGLCDATSVYGYAGPLASHTTVPKEVINGFHRGLHERLKDMDFVSVFSRLHPLITNADLINGLGEIVHLGETVSINLELPDEAQYAAFRTNHKRGIRKLRAAGVTTERISIAEGLKTFISIYHETMQRVDASGYYFFTEEYFYNLTEALRDLIHLFVCKLDNQIIAGGLFSLCNGIVQYHLGATRNDHLRLAPMKLLFESVRQWSNQQHAHIMHLGGGVGVLEDSLFHFKAGFSDSRHLLSQWRWIVDPVKYRELCELRHKSPDESNSFFPAYRNLC